MIATSNGYIMIYKDNSLSFEVRGSQFPNYGALTNTNNGMIFRSFVSQSVTVNWGDGEVENFQMKPDINSLYTIAWVHDAGSTGTVVAENQMPKHIYQDANAGHRIITFNFDDISELQSVEARYIYIEGIFPVNISSASELEALELNTVSFLTSFPAQLSNLQKLRRVVLNAISQSRFTRIPDGFFDLNIEVFRANNTFNLSDKTASNFFKVNQWQNITDLSLTGSMITEVDETFRELDQLVLLDLTNNNFSAFPEELQYLTELTRLRIGFGNVHNIPMMDFSNLNKVSELGLTTNTNGSFLLSDIPEKWEGLFSLAMNQAFPNFTRTNLKFNEFIHALYELCTTHASIVPGGGAAPYPNRYRNIAWGADNRTIDSPKVAPPGYEQGVSNGDAVTAGEKAYVLQNQYNHTITHA